MTCGHPLSPNAAPQGFTSSSTGVAAMTPSKHLSQQVDVVFRGCGQAAKHPASIPSSAASTVWYMHEALMTLVTPSTRQVQPDPSPTWSDAIGHDRESVTQHRESVTQHTTIKRHTARRVLLNKGTSRGVWMAG